MKNQIKAEFYKLRHSFSFWGIPVIFILCFLFYIAINTVEGGVYMMYGYSENVGSIGFSYFTHSGAAFTSQDLLTTVVSSMFFLWIFMLIFSVQFFSSDFHKGTIKNAYVKGIRGSTVYLAKNLVIMLYFALFYILLHIVIIFYSRNIMGLNLTSNDYLEIFSRLAWCFIVMIVFMLISNFLSVVIDSSALTSVILCASVFLGMIAFTFNWADATTFTSIPIYLRLFPTSYWMVLTQSQVTEGIYTQILIYFAAAVVIFVPSTLYTLEKKEIR